jgi:tetratricopeptide (TPR) repeat protein
MLDRPQVFEFPTQVVAMSAPLALARRITVCFLLSVAAICTLAGAVAAQGLDAAEDQQGQQQIDPQAEFNRGEEALAKGDFDTALDAYDKLVNAFKQQTASPFLPAIHTGRGRAFLGLNDLESALADFNAAIAADTYETYWPARVFRGNLYLGVNQPGAALGDFQAAVEQQRRNVEALFGLGKSMVLLGGSQQAIKPLSYVLSAGDDDESAVRLRAEAYSLRAQANAGILKLDEAHEDIERSMAINPDNYETHFALGTIYLREEKYAEAAEAFADAIERYVPKDPDSAEPFAQGYLTKAATMVELGKHSDDSEVKRQAYEAAVADCDTLLELVGDSPIYAGVRSATEYRRGVAFRMLGRLGDAINALTEAININPELSEAYLRRGICFYHINEDKLAEADFRMAASIAYDDPRMRLWEGFTLAKMGEYYEAIRAYGQAITESDRYVPAFVNRGLAYLALEDYEKAIADFDDAIRLEPTVAGHYFKRGVAYEGLGDYEKAADSFANAARFDEEFVPAYRRAADALAAMGQNELAGEYRKTAAELAAKQQPKP